jgi:hypothetical protein
VETTCISGRQYSNIIYYARLTCLLGFPHICLMVHFLSEYSILSHRLQLEVNTSRSYQNINNLMSLGFKKSVVDPNLYYKIVNGESLIFVLYVDDLFLTGIESLIVECKYVLVSEFEMKDLGMMHYFLALEVWQRTDEIFLN